MLVVLSALIAPAWSADLWVGPTRAWTTPEAAIAVAADGDRLLLDPGTYVGGVVVFGKSLTIEGVGGSGAVTLTGDGTAPTVLDLALAKVWLVGLTIDGAGTHRGVGLYQGTLDLDDVVVTHGFNRDGRPGAGLSATGAAQVTIARSAFEDNAATVGGVDLGGHLALEGGSVLTVVGDVSFVDGEAGAGGAVYVGATSSADFVGAAFERNLASGAVAASGGAILAEPGAWLSVTDSTFVDNAAGSSGSEGGGAIFGQSAIMHIERSAFEGNGPVHDGGAIVNERGSLFVSGSIFHDNEASHGGAVTCRDTVACELWDVWFQGNRSELGGALQLERATGFVVQSVLCDNWSQVGVGSGDGGAVALREGELFLTSSVLFGNHAEGEGGGVALIDAYGELVNNHLIGNTAGGRGGAVVARSDLVGSKLSLLNDLVAWNASLGAAVTLEGTPWWYHHDAWFENVPRHSSTSLDPTHRVDLDPRLLGGTVVDCSVVGMVPRLDSPLVDAGDPVLLDPDGSPSDIGAFGGPAADPDLFADADGDGLVAMFDCRDDDPDVQDAAVLVYTDADGDGVGAASDPGVWACPGPDQVRVSGDCDDADPTVVGALSWWGDGDGDGFGDPRVRVEDCAGGPGLVRDGTDCDDTRADVHPGATEAWYDGVDSDCDGADDFDQDRDGARADTYDGDDCDDLDPAVGPFAIDILDDGIDQDCDGLAAHSWVGGGGRSCAHGGSPLGWPWWVILGCVVRRRGAQLQVARTRRNAGIRASSPDRHVDRRSTSGSANPAKRRDSRVEPRRVAAEATTRSGL